MEYNAMLQAGLFRAFDTKHPGSKQGYNHPNQHRATWDRKKMRWRDLAARKRRRAKAARMKNRRVMARKSRRRNIRAA